MEPKMNFYYPGSGAVAPTPGIPAGEAVESTETTPTTLPKPKTRKEYFLKCFFDKLNVISPDDFNGLLIPEPNDKDKTDDLRFAWLVRKFVSPNPFELSDNAYTLSIKPVELAASYGVNIKSLANFNIKHSNVIFGLYYEVIIDNTYSCKVFVGSEDTVPCGPYTITDIISQNEEVLSIISETEPTHIPVVDVYAYFVIAKQPKSTLEYYIAKAAGCQLLNTDNPPEPKTAEEIYWAYVCNGSHDAGDLPVTPANPEIPKD